MSDAGLFELPQKYLDLQAEARRWRPPAPTSPPGPTRPTASTRTCVDRLRQSGLADVVVDAEYGGRFEQVDSLAVTVVREALCSESAHLDSMFAMQGIGSFPLSVGGSERGPQASGCRRWRRWRRSPRSP